MDTIYQLNPSHCFFPPAEKADKRGLLAFGGDLSPERILVAYASGIFPWYSEGEPYLWWSLDPRLVIRPGEMKVSKSLRHVIRSGRFEYGIDTNFRAVIENCAASPRKGQSGTWIVKEMIEAYCALHTLGFAHSFETYENGTLVGGLYGIAIGTVFCGESMFHKVPDASKAAFYKLHVFLQENGYKLIDCQQETKHLKSLGAYSIPRKEYLNELSQLVKAPCILGNWGNGKTEPYLLHIERPDNLSFRTLDLR